ncbi:iron-sulfur cluster assembly accessory protein [Candidatus Palauibacter sp.]|uniref:iron-sulfur cluster assembly accessory protein n=1 Tax=Candidatus Palauibacter sp. TaxID=3101350 RepID=UPI003B01BA30
MADQELLTFSEAAHERIRTFMSEDPAEGLAVRVSVQNASPIAPEYEMALIEPLEREEGDESFDASGFEVVVDSRSVALLAGTRIDWVESMQGSGFHFRNPNIQPLGSGPMDGPLVDRVRRVIDEQINPGVASHGGTVRLVDIRDNVVYVTMGGGCQGCGMASVTLTQGIKQMIRDAAPEIVDVQDVTDHASGSNPYYA